MSYLVLARKWRPMRFDEVVAQRHVTLTLENAIRQNRLASAYLFAGPRGVGKTTTARLLAKAVNCVHGPTVTPCNECPNCVEITESRSLDVFEIDGASNRGIDEVRNLRENIRYAPARGKARIYIIDEVHMLTTEAFNALLKVLEEPPRHVMFIFATTEPQKVPPTILSRCQRFDFRRIPTGEITEQLKRIGEVEAIDSDAESLRLIAKKADGSLRDALSILDQVIAFCGEKVRVEDVLGLLGIIPQDLFFEVSDLIRKKDVQGGFEFADRVLAQGYDVSEFFVGLAEHFRNFLIVKNTNDTTLLEVSEVHAQRYREEAGNFQDEDLLRLIQIATETEYQIKRSPTPKIRLEMALVKMSKLDSSVQLGQLLERLEDLKKNIEGETTAASSPQSSGKIVQSVLKIQDEIVEVVKPEPSSVEAPKSKLPASAEPTVTIEIVREKWGLIVEEVKRRKIALGSFLNEGYPSRLEEGILEITFGMDNGFHINSINRSKNVIQDVLKSILGVSWRIQCKKVEGTVNQPEATPKVSQPAQGARFEAFMEKYPVVKTIVEVFDAELIPR